MPSNILTSLLFFLLPVFPSAAEKEDFFVYEASARSADELQKAVQGINNGARATVLNHKLIIYGTRRQREQMLRLLQELDHKLQNYVVKFRIAKSGSASTQRLEAEGVLVVDGVQLSKRPGSARAGNKLGAEWKNKAGHVRLSGSEGEAVNQGNADVSLVVGEGGTAKIYSDSGLFSTNVIVTVRSIGKVGARLQIRQSDSDASGAQSLITEINVPLSEWRTVGGLGELQNQRTKVILGSSKEKNQVYKDIQVRVDLQREP